MKRIVCMLLVLLMLVPMIAVNSSAAPATKNEKTRAISIVFDNSGSMYYDFKGNNPDAAKAWCRATYAMEVFASMLNSNDIMDIYPMNTITVDGTEYIYHKNSLRVTQQTAGKIREIATGHAGGTPLQSITAAYKGLLKQTADEKYLIVLTDGDYFHDLSRVGNEKLSVPESEAAVNGLIQEYVQGVKVMYLGIGTEAIMPNGVSSANLKAVKAENSADVLAALSQMCNDIFGRKSLSVSGKSVEFDLAMSKLIVFVQGENIQNVKLGGKSPKSSSSMRYSEKLAASTGAPGLGELDTSLQGMLAIFEDVEAGSYGITFDGQQTSIDCYYEPDVDFIAELRDAAGNPVTPGENMTVGTYYLHYSLVDNKGKEVPADHPLLGTPQYEIRYTINGEEKVVTATKGGDIELNMQPKDVMDASFRITYLDDYTILRDTDDLGWPAGGITFEPPPAGMLDIKISGGQAQYKLSQLAQSEMFRVDFIYDGQTLSGAQLDGLEQLQVKVNGGNMNAELKKDEKGYYIQLSYAGSALETECGDYELQVGALYRNADGLETNLAGATVGCNLTDDSRSFSMEVIVEQDYYQQSKISEGEPILVKLTFDGAQLTQEELDAIVLDVQSGKLQLTQEADYANSCYVLRIQGTPDTDDYEIVINATGVNEIGRKITLTEEVEIEVGSLPMWLRVLIPILIILLLITAFVLWRNMLKLPKEILLLVQEFQVDGESIPGKGEIEFPGKGKKTSSLRVLSPKCGTVPGARQSITMDLEAVSKRKDKSSMRKAKVISAPRVGGAMNVTSWKVRNATYIPDPDKPGSFVHSSTGKPFQPFEISNNSEVAIEADVQGTSVFFRGKLQFK